MTGGFFVAFLALRYCYENGRITTEKGFDQAVVMLVRGDSMINNTLAKKRIIAAVAVTVVLIAAIVAVPVIRREICYGTVVGECDNQELVERWQQYGEAYAIGANKDGMPIFKDRKAAMKQAKKDYGLGFEYLREYRNFPKISDNPKVCQQYKMLGWQTVPPMTVENYEEIGRQCGMVSRFLDIYCNSFGEDG